MFLRRCRCVAMLAVSVLALAASVARADYIDRFDSQIKVNRDASLDITETITVVFESPRHGIYRFIPVRYERYGNPFTIEMRLSSVTDDAGRDVRYTTARQGRDFSMKIGDKNVEITGEHTYVIRYRVRRAVNFFCGAPEVYWNVTGDQWPYPIRRATATIVLPEGVDLSQVRHDCFVGPPGSTARGQHGVSGNDIQFGAGGIQAGSGMTIVAGLPAGSVTKPTFSDELWWFIRDWWPVPVFPMLALGLAMFAWHRGGRDEGAGRQAIGVEFEPPKDLTPSEVGTLIDERADTPDIIATLIDLAARGWLTIREVQTSRLLFLSNRDYEFIRKSPPPRDAPLKPHEQRFLSGLFENNVDVATLSSLKNRFYRHIDPMKREIYHSLTDMKLFKENPEQVRNRWIGGGIALIVLGAILCFLLRGWIAFGIGSVAAGIVLCLVSRAMPAKTMLGTRRLIECLSFKRFVSMVETDRIRTMAMNDPTIFGRLLPYAMVLGVADQWAQAFAGLLTQAPEWYQTWDNRPFNSLWFINDLGGGMRTMQRTMTSMPQPKSAGSGGSGFGGGGFSGGGFGGGGGGSW